jgi:hypothetical protein
MYSINPPQMRVSCNAFPQYTEINAEYTGLQENALADSRANTHNKIKQNEAPVSLTSIKPANTISVTTLILCQTLSTVDAQRTDFSEVGFKLVLNVLVVFIKMNTASFLLISVKISNQSFGRK